MIEIEPPQLSSGQNINYHLIACMPSLDLSGAFGQPRTLSRAPGIHVYARTVTIADSEAGPSPTRPWMDRLQLPPQWLLDDIWWRDQIPSRASERLALLSHPD